MALPTCECVKGLPIGEQLAAIYCATYTLAAGDVDGPYLLKAANLSDVADPEESRVNLGADVGGIWPASLGGTGQSSYAVGDLLYASGAAALSKLADVATGNALISGGVGVAPSWGKIGLTTHVNGVLPIANGGTAGSTALSARTNLGFLSAVKAADESRTNDTAFTNDSSLTFAVEAGKTYFFEADIYVTEASAVPGIGIGINAPASTLFRFSVEASNGTTIFTVLGDGAAGTPYYIEGNTAIVISIRGAITPSASGTLAFAWRQSSSSGDATVVKAGSYMIVTESTPV